MTEIIEQEQEKPCRHEYIKIFQRRLKGLDRRLVSTRGFLPIGFKQADFGHLSEGAFCFCVKCRARLFPRRTVAEKAAARVALAQSKLAEFQEPELFEAIESGIDLTTTAAIDQPLEETSTTINVEELDYVAAELQDIEADGVKLTQEDSEESLAIDDEEI
jgi:hypothetical protein